jgi:methylase of polypeptide subunit release factors
MMGTFNNFYRIKAIFLSNKRKLKTIFIIDIESRAWKFFEINLKSYKLTRFTYKHI